MDALHGAACLPVHALVADMFSQMDEGAAVADYAVVTGP